PDWARLRWLRCKKCRWAKRSVPTRSHGVGFARPTVQSTNSLPPSHPVPPLPALPRIEFFAAEASREFFRIRRGGEAVDVEPLPVVTDAMAARAQRQILAEIVDGLVAAVFAGARRQRDLVRPAAVDGGRR